ncbi:TPA: hypothetical protein RG685_000720 [Morganella morganii]|nr:hypothetical protein [Morganella morganii]
MKKIGDVTSTADKNGEWTNGNVAAGIAPTILEAGWLNSVQREILGVLVEAGIAQDKNNDNQLKDAIKKIISGGDYATKTEVNSKLSKDQNGADIPNKEIFIKNLGLPEKFQEVGYSYSKKESDDNFQPKGKYASSEIFNTPGNGYTYMNSPAKKYRAVIGDNGEFAVINGENPLNPSTFSFDKNGIMQNGVVPATRVTGLFSKYLAVAGGRVIGTTYTNSNDKPMFIIISFGNYNGSMSIYVNDEIVYETGNTSNGITRVSAFFMVPPRGTYRVGAGSIAFEKWTECV